MEESIMTVTKAAITSSGVARVLRACGLMLLVASMALGCEQPKQDSFRYEGGASPDPTGIITGSVAYLGPQPSCEYDGDKPTRVIGRVILTLFVYENPSPPEGRATSAENLLAISGSKLFSLEDCLPEGQPPNPAQRITRSVEYRWTAIPLRETEVRYQIRGFYDYDEDMIPFFSVTRLPTQGDIAGGAVRDFLDPNKGFQPVVMPSRTAGANGFVRSNITVGLNQYIWTERPAFELSVNRALSAEWAVPVAVDFANIATFGADARKTLLQTWPLTCAEGAKEGNAFRTDCGFTVETLSEEDAAVMAKSTVEVDTGDDLKAAIYSTFVDVRTIKKKENPSDPYVPDVILPDGKADPHPVLGTTTSLDINWYQPIVLLQRTPFVLGYDPANQANIDTLAAIRKLELDAGIPSVSLVGAHVPAAPAAMADVDPGEAVEPGKKAYYESTPVVVPPVAVVDIDPAGITDAGKAGLCRVPYIPFGGPGTAPGERTTTRTFESRLTDCQDLPTGVYGVNVLSGVAGGTLRDAEDGEISDNGKVAEGTRYSGQSWSLPNELGNPVQVKGNVLASQGWDKLFIVHDPDPEPSDECTTETTIDTLGREGNNPTGEQVKVTLRGLCDEGEARIDEDADGVDGTMCMDPDCCEAVKHLCGVPLCDVIKLDEAEGLSAAEENDDSAWNVRGSPSTVELKPFSLTITQNGVRGTKQLQRGVPNCIPFALPSQCCAE
jgi:hypothetical protein